MDLIPVAGSLLSATTLGAGSPPLVMIHGLMFGNLATWYSPIAAPLSRDRQVLLYDQRGHGSSAVTPSGYDLKTQAQDLNTVLTHYGRGEQMVDVVGHSMGALIALQFALSHPGRVRRLVLVDPPYPVAEQVLPDLLSVPSAESLSAYIDARAGQQSGRRLERMRQRLAALLFETTLVSDLQSVRSFDDAELGALACPILVVVGERSSFAEAVYDLQRRMPRAQVASVDCGHYIPEEAPAALRQLIADFCGGDA